MSMTLNFLGGAPFQLLYDGVKLALSNSRKFKTNLRSLKFTLDCLQPQIIEQIRLQNMQLNLAVQEIQELQRKMDEGIVLIDRLSSLSTWNICIWGDCCNCMTPGYADRLDELNESLRRLLEILRLQSIAQVNQVVILARTTRDKQDELGKRQLEILSNQQYIIDALRKQQQVVERIERNGVAASTGREGAAPAQVLHLEAVFQAIFNVVVQVKVKNSTFKRLLEDFKFTLDCLKPLVQEIAERNKILHFPKEEVLEDFVVYLEKGVELVYKCSKGSLWSRFKKYKYMNNLFELDEYLQRLFNILKLQIENDVKEALVLVSNLEKEIEEIEGSGVLQEHQYKGAAAEPQLSKVELDVINIQARSDVKESIDSARNVEVGDESHKRIEGSSWAPHRIDVAVVKPPSPTMALDIVSIPETLDSATNMEVGVERTEGTGEKDREIWVDPCKEAEEETSTPTVPVLAAHKRQASVETLLKNNEENYAATRVQEALRSSEKLEVDYTNIKSEYTAHLSSYEAACKLDSGLQSFDVSLQQRTSRVINSLSTGVEVRSLSLDSLKEVSDCLLEMNQEVVSVILECKKDVWNNQEIFSLVEEYFENCLQTLDFCTALESCLKRAVNNQLKIQAVMRRFEEEVEAGFQGEGCVRILQELRAFKAAGDPFTEEFFVLFQAVYNQQASMLQKLQVRKRKLDKKLKSVKAWRKVSNVIFVATFVSVLIFSVVAAAIAAPPLVTALAGALAVPIGSVGKWCNMLWSCYERALKGQREIISSMQVGSMITMTDLNNIRVLVEKFEIKIEALLQNADFAIREEDAVKIVMIEINKKLEKFMETIESLSQNADKCCRNIRKARTVILQRIIRHPIK